MKNVKVKIIDRRPQVKVGDRVEFQIGEETFTDVVTYVMGHIVEGEKWCLSHTKFNVVKRDKSPVGRNPILKKGETGEWDSLDWWSQRG